MSYQVLARKWRPQTFGDIVGQGAAAVTLKNAILKNRIAHAYLFAGARGVGKTTTARILAKALNCEKGPTVDPCNQCASCREVTAGQSIDVLEIDAASNRGIDEIRELRENVRYVAARDRYKVFIIDEVHMLTTEAFNALLKTLEEPPPHVVFILATTELHKVPGTILSRCQHFTFRAIGHREILERLAFIASQEQVRIGERALGAIARASEGSLRDAQSLLDQMISLCGQEVDDEQVRDLLGIVPQQLLEDFTDAAVSRDTKRVLVLVDGLMASGRSPQQLVRDLMGHFRNLLMVKIAGRDSQLVAAPADELERMEQVGASLSEEDLTRFLQILVATDGELRWSAHPRLHLEMGLVRIVQARRLAAMEEVLAALAEGRKPESPAPRPHSKAPPPTPSSAPAVLEDSDRLVKDGGSTLQGGIRQVLEKDAPSVAPMIEAARDLTVAGDELRIRFDDTQHFHGDMLQDPERLKAVERAGEKIVGRSMRVRVELNEAVRVPAAVERPPGGELEEPVSEPVLEDERVRRFLEVFRVRSEEVEVRKLT